MTPDEVAAHEARVAAEIARWEKFLPSSYDEIARRLAEDLETAKATEARAVENRQNAQGELLRFRSWRDRMTREHAEAVGRMKAVTMTVSDWHNQPREVSVALIEPGHVVDYSGKRSWDTKPITVGKVFEVSEGDEVIGFVFYDMLTRENRTPGRRYVNSRWESPGWRSAETRNASYKPERSSKKDAIEALVRDHTRKAI